MAQLAETTSTAAMDAEKREQVHAALEKSVDHERQKVYALQVEP